MSKDSKIRKIKTAARPGMTYETKTIRVKDTYHKAETNNEHSRNENY